MGRYKRHAKTKTITIPNTSRQHPTTITYSIINEHLDKPKTPLTDGLIKNIMLVAKKNRICHKVISVFNPLTKRYKSDSELPNLVFYRPRVYIGNNIIYEYNRHIQGSYLYETPIGRIILADRLLIPKNKASMSALEFKRELVGMYAKQELEKENIKVYPNNLVYSYTFGTIFAAIGFLAIIWLIIEFFGVVPAFIYALFVTLLLKIKIS